jgi:hypothetical protein
VSTSHHYRSNLRDISFNLFEFLDVGKTSLGKGPFAPMDEDTARESLKSLDVLATQEMAPSFAAADREIPTIDDQGNVFLPEVLKRAIATWFDGDWHRMNLPEHMGGFGAPPSVFWAGFELVAGANGALSFYTFGSVIARVVDSLGSDAQKARFLPKMVDEQWGGAMVLTEPDAGSDVGAARAKATQAADGTWHITGTKRFITNGDYDVPSNILHLVLARPEGAGAGTKGLSMFLVPKFWVEADGSTGARNGWVVTKLEKKMGLKASVTCEVEYGGDTPARGLLVGEVHDGIRQMFQVIEQARMAVGVKSLATLSTGYLNALAYARDRVQGADLPEAANKAAPRVNILRHADVRRMLMLQKSHAEGMRALALFTAHIQDQVALLGGHGAKEAARLDALNDLLLPLVKGYNSEKAQELLSLSLQCYGGSGYVMDFPVEQYMRDQRIDTLYEGTTHIQGLDLFFRKVGRDGGQTLQGLLGQVQKTLETNEGGEGLAEARAHLAAALGDVQAMFMSLAGRLGESVHHVGLHANRLLATLAEVVIGWLLVRHAALATAKLPQAEGPDVAFYKGKIASAVFFAKNVLPASAVARKLVEASSLDIMQIEDEAFG